MSQVKPMSIDLQKAGPSDLDFMCDLTDCGLRGDAYIPRGQMEGILKRATSDVYIIVYNGEVAGFAIMYRTSVLHNIFLHTWARGLGVGAEVVKRLNPSIVRAKTNMRDGDPTQFYAKLDYQTVGVDEARPHINIMAKRHIVAEQQLKPSLYDEEQSHSVDRAMMLELENYRRKEEERKAKNKARQNRRREKLRQVDTLTSVSA